MWPFSSRKTRPVKPARRIPSSYKPYLEAFEDRCLLSAGALDTTFGNGAGYITTSLNNSRNEIDNAYSALLQSDGRMVVVGSSASSLNGPAVALARYNTDGSLDSSFGNAGKVIGPAYVNTGFIHAALYPAAGTANDGKIVVGGLSGGFSIARYNANGSLDTSFGSGGIATANFGTTSNYDVFFEIVQPDGKIVALGQTADYTHGQMARFNADGSLDATFGQGGMVTGPVPDPFSLLLQPDGKLVMVGDVAGPYGGGSELARYNANGTLDTSFGNGGVVINNAMGFAFAGALYPVAGTPNDGKIIVVGDIKSGLELVRYNSDGSLDGTFRNGSVMPTTQIGGDLYNTQGVALQADGRIVVTGYGALNASIFTTARFNLDGSLDSSFGSGGVTTTSIAGLGVANSGHAVTIQANGDIVVAGYSYDVTKGQRDFAVARYLGGPRTGPLFSVTGFPSNATAGVANTITVTAEDASGNPNPGYTGTVHFTSSDPHAVLPADYTFSAADQGVHTFGVTFKTAGFQSVNITDVSTAYSGGDGAITVNPAAASSFIVSGFPTSITQGTAGTFTVTAMDAYGNIATGYTGTVTFSSSDPLASLPGSYTFTAADVGVHTFSATLNAVGTESLTATDTLTASITGTETGIVVKKKKGH